MILHSSTIFVAVVAVVIAFNTQYEVFAGLLFSGCRFHLEIRDLEEKSVANEYKIRLSI